MAIQISNEVHEEAYGAVAGTIQQALTGKDPVHGLILNMDALQDGAVVMDISDVVTQVASAITVKAGGAEVFSLSGADLHHLLGMAMPSSYNVLQHDGTGGDGDGISCSLPIPLGPFSHGNAFHPEFGLDPKKEDIVVQVDFPADANEIDTRLFNLEVISLLGKTPNKYIERVTRNKTFNAVGWGQYEDLPDGPNVSLYDLYFYQTSAFTDATASIASGIERLSLQVNKTEVGIKKLHTRSLQYLIGNLSLTLGAIEHPAQYIYGALNPLGEYEYSIPLNDDARFEFEAGVAEAIRTLCGIIRPL